MAFHMHVHVLCGFVEMPALASFADAKLLDFSPSDLAYSYIIYVLFIREVIILYTLYTVCM
jgi:hypothetical protein